MLVNFCKVTEKDILVLILILLKDLLNCTDTVALVSETTF